MQRGKTKTNRRTLFVRTVAIVCAALIVGSIVLSVVLIDCFLDLVRQGKKIAAKVCVVRRHHGHSQRCVWIEHIRHIITP